jgi:hypothetical protein
LLDGWDEKFERRPGFSLFFRYPQALSPLQPCILEAWLHENKKERLCEILVQM